MAERAVPSEGALRPFIIISLSYILFTTTDGAVRMIVLLHAYQQVLAFHLCVSPQPPVRTYR